LIRFITSVFTLIIISLCPLSLTASECTKINLSSEFNHLLKITTCRNESFNIEKTASLIKAVSSDELKKTLQLSDGLKGLPSSYYAFNISSSLKRLLKYSYNTQIPGCAVQPEYIRLTEWKNASPTGNNTAEFWEQLDLFKQPVIKKGTLYMQNTPDIHTGAYYGYESFKSGILLKHQGKNVFISVSKQKDISEVGKKGFILGEGVNRDYFYSGEPGLNKFGLGSIKSYLYDAFSVTVYVEAEPGLLKCATFKWLKAGWAGMNMIKPEHIKKGLKRFVRQQKSLIESDSLPSYERLVSTCAKYNTLPESEIITLVKSNLSKLMLSCNTGTDCPKILKKDFNPDIYISRMTKEEMKASLIQRDMKKLYLSNKQKTLKLSLKN